MINDENEANQLAQVVQRMEPESRLLRWWPLAGGVSAQMTALEIARTDGSTQKFVVRQHGEINRNVAADEFKLLHILKSAGLPVPTLYHIDESGEILPTPYLVLEYIEGAPEFAPSNLQPFIHRLAATLAAIHRVDRAGLDFLPKQADIYTAKFREHPAMLDDSLDEGHIRATLERVWPLPNMNQTTLHGDFWPGNVLWNVDELVAVIDWEDARSGNPLEDMANTRMEILWAYGIEAMRDFTYQYQTIMPALDYTHLPHWDLCAALRPASKLGGWGLDAAKETLFRERHRWFVSQAFEKLHL